MSKKISELTTTSEASNEDILILNQNDETKQISKEDLFADTEQHIENITTEIDNMLGIEEYSDELTYKIGDYCFHENNLYVCNTDIPAREVWDSAKWTQTELSEGIVRRTAGATLSGLALKLGDITMQVGKITGVNVKASGVTEVTTTFPKAFDSDPIVLVAPLSGYNIGGQPSDITTTSFKLNARSYDGVARNGRTYTYIAIGFIQ